MRRHGISRVPRIPVRRVARGDIGGRIGPFGPTRVPAVLTTIVPVTPRCGALWRVEFRGTWHPYRRPGYGRFPALEYLIIQPFHPAQARAASHAQPCWHHE